MAQRCDICETDFENNEEVIHYEDMIVHKECLKKFKNKAAGRKYKCPKCKGTGLYEFRYNAYPSGLPDSDWAEDWKTGTTKCDLCDGHGATEKEYIPEYEVVGYKTK